MQIEKIKTTGLFTNYIYKAIPLAFDESMSYYETLCGLLSYLKDTVIPTVNNNADAIIEVQNLMNELQSYVDNYFKNLDVQNEINNKLDQMATDGELEEIISAYLKSNAIIGYNTVIDLKNATNLIDGSFTKTYGKISYNDGLGAFYKIRTITNEDHTDDDNLIALTNYPNLVAEKMKNKNIVDLNNSIDTINQSINTINQDIADTNTRIDNTNEKIDTIPYFLKGKKILVIGDSISNEVDGVLNWVKYLRENYKCEKVDNISYNGALLTGEGGQAKNYDTTVTEKYDYIIIFLGINDAYHQASLTRLGYAYNDSNTFSGSLTFLANSINSKDPDAHVIYVAPLKNMYEQTNRTFVDVYRSYIYHACNLFGWTFIDAGHSAPMLNPMNGGNKNKYLPDGLHPSASYAPILANYIVSKIISNGDNSIGDFHSRMDFSNILTSEITNGALFIEFNSNGSVKVVLDCPNISVGTGLGVSVTTSLPDWAVGYSDCYGQCWMGIHQMPCRITGHSMQIFPDITQTGAIHAEIDINHTLLVEPMGYQI